MLIVAYFSEILRVECERITTKTAYLTYFLLSPCVVYASRLIYGYFIGLSVTNFLSTVKPVK